MTRARLGFTLMEVLLAVALVAALIGSMLAFLVDVSAYRTEAQSAATSRRAADILIDRIETDLLTCVINDGSGRAGVDGTGTSLRILTRGVAAPLALRESPERTLGDLQLAEYRFDAGSRTLSACRGPVDAGATPDSMDGAPERIRFRYHDGDRWLDSFNSATLRRLPIAVEVAVWFHHPDSERPFSTPPAPDAEPSGDMQHDGGDEIGLMPVDGFDAEDSMLQVDESMPDRLRVIAVPDAVEDGEPASRAGGPA